MTTVRANGKVRTLEINGQAIEFDAEKIALMQRTIARGSSDDELELFIEQCRRTGLDPFARQIFAVRRKQWNPDTRTSEEVQVIQVSIDGYRLVADRTGKYAGQVGPWWCGLDGEWREVWLANEPPAAAKIGVLRHDFHQPLYSIALFKSYVQTNRNGEPVSRWKSDPAGMLAKCAESLALRRAFPQELSGLYTGEEMDQADNPVLIDAGPSLPALPGAVVTELPGLPEPVLNLEITEAELVDLPEEITQPEPEQPKQPAPAPIKMTLEQAKAVEASDRKKYGDLTLSALVNRANNMRKMLATAESAGDLEQIATYRHKLAACDLLIPWRRKVGDPKPEQATGSKSDSAEREAKIQTELGFNEPAPTGDKYADLVKMSDKTTAFWMLTNRAKIEREQATRILAEAGDDFGTAFNKLLDLIRAA